jgi:hypothetical protein
MSDWLEDLKATAMDCPPTQIDQEERREQVAMRRALNLRRDVEAFEARWPEAPDREGALVPGFTWSQLERQLVDLSDTPVKAAMALDLVTATRKMARFKPPEMVLREILCLTWALLDEGFQPELGEDLQDPP